MPHHIDFRGEKVVPITEEQTILEASLAAGIPHYHACGGKGQCTTCRILVLEGAECLTDKKNYERAVSMIRHFPQNVRLACQTHVMGDGVKVHRLIKDDVDHYLFIDEETDKNMAVTGVYQKLALFFIDIRSFTPFVEANLPFDVIHIMRRIFALFRNAIEHYDGRIIDTAGDGLYAVFGLNSKVATAAESAVLAGLKILNDLSIFNNTYMRPYFDHSFEVGIGVHVGKVICGNVGIGLNNNLTVMGFPVNVAARLQSSTKELNNSFVISEKAYSLLKQQPYAMGQANIQLKGVSSPFAVRLIGKPYRAAPAPSELD